MEESRSPVRWKSLLGWVAVLILPSAILLLMAGPPEERSQPAAHRAEPPGGLPRWRDILAAPLVRPGAVAAKDAGLSPDEPVIGVVAGGRARAYRLAAMEARSRHLINDVIGDRPVSVVYCDLGHCVRAYRGPAGSGELPLSVAGLLDDRMVLSTGGAPYFQESGRLVDPEPLEASHDPVAIAYARAARQAMGARPGGGTIPLEPAEYVETTWGDWVRRHPDTDAYVGPPDRPKAAGK